MPVYPVVERQTLRNESLVCGLARLESLVEPLGAGALRLASVVRPGSGTLNVQSGPKLKFHGDFEAFL